MTWNENCTVSFLFQKNIPPASRHLVGSCPGAMGGGGGGGGSSATETSNERTSLHKARFYRAAKN